MRGTVLIHSPDGEPNEMTGVNLSLSFTEEGSCQTLIYRMKGDRRHYLFDLEGSACEILEDRISIVGYSRTEGEIYLKYRISFKPDS